MTDTTPINVLAVSGSLRRESFNSASLRAARALAPAGMSMEIADLRDIPPYDEDVKQAGFPAAVDELRGRVRAADALLIATPEYNYSYSGLLKNAIDWISRPPDQPFQDKPIAILSASPGLFGGARAQYHLRQCFIYLDAKVMNQPEVMIAQAQQRFDGAGELTDEPTRQLLGKFLASLAAWTNRIKTSRTAA